MINKKEAFASFLFALSAKDFFESQEPEGDGAADSEIFIEPLLVSWFHLLVFIFGIFDECASFGFKLIKVEFAMVTTALIFAMIGFFGHIWLKLNIDFIIP